MNETYHSTHGALTESQYVFIEKGLAYLLEENPDKENVKILEVGFGTGLNALLTVQYANQFQVHIEYDSLETQPLPFELIEDINYPDLIGGNSKNQFLDLHKAKWNGAIDIDEYLTVHKIKDSIQDYSFVIDKYDLVFFDAFAPSKQPEMWRKEVLEKIYEAMALGSLLVTYCAQGQFKRDLKACGFSVEKLPGPPGKAEMTRGIKL